MTKLTLLVFVFAVLATGYLQEVSNNIPELSSNSQNTGTTKELWLQQFQGLRRNGKPCPRRSNGNLGGTWIPSYSSRISHPLHEQPILQPQALRNEEFREVQVNPTENYQPNSDTRRSLTSSSSLTPLKNDDDCDDQLEAVNMDSSPDPNAQKTALKIIEDCLNKKQGSEKPLGSSRRSMPDDDSVNDDENNDYLREPRTYDILDQTEDSDSRRKGNMKTVQANFEASYPMQQISQNSDITERTGLVGSGNGLNDLRICYACSTSTNPTCWEPDKRTTIKYCRKEHSCVTKTFGVKNQVTLIRDCANSCTDTSVPGIEPKYKSCKICHKDYCNSAMSATLNIYSLSIFLIMTIVKCTF